MNYLQSQREASKDKASREADESLASVTSRQLASGRLASSSGGSGQIQILETTMTTIKIGAFPERLL